MCRGFTSLAGALLVAFQSLSTATIIPQDNKPTVAVRSALEVVYLSNFVYSSHGLLYWAGMEYYSDTNNSQNGQYPDAIASEAALKHLPFALCISLLIALLFTYMSWLTFTRHRCQK
jgi:hypothetical protein